jgi:hypothetical protein
MSRASPAPRTVGTFAPDDWWLLVRLPAAVMVATVGAQQDPPRRTVAEGLAGLDAIAAGRASDSELVRTVVAAIYAEPDDGVTESDAGSGGTPGGADLYPVLSQCRRVTEVLRHGADPADADAYRQWVRDIAERVCAATRSGGVLGLSGEQIGPAEQQLLDELATALS